MVDWKQAMGSLGPQLRSVYFRLKKQYLPLKRGLLVTYRLKSTETTPTNEPNMGTNLSLSTLGMASSSGRNNLLGSGKTAILLYILLTFYKWNNPTHWHSPKCMPFCLGEKPHRLANATKKK